MQIPKRKPGKYSGDPADNYLSPEAIGKLKSDIEHIEKILVPEPSWTSNAPPTWATARTTPPIPRLAAG